MKKQIKNESEIATIEPNQLTEARVFKSEELNKQTAVIMSAMLREAEAKEHANIEKAKAFGMLVKSGVDFKAEGFKNMEDYGKQLFNLSTASIYNYRKVGLSIIDGTMPTEDKNGKKLSFTAMVELLGLADSHNRRMLLDSGEIDADTTAAEVRKAVKESKPKKETKQKNEKQFSIYSTINKGEPVAVTTISNFKAENGEPFHEWKQNGIAYMLYVDSDGEARVFYHSTGKVVESEA